MKENKIRKPDFLIIGAPRSGTTWLWEVLKQHPGTDLPKQKEPFFFGSSEIYGKGKLWYYSHFRGIDIAKVTGEGSTSNFYDHVPYFFNAGKELLNDNSLPVIPKLITEELPRIKIFICLRDPVQRAISHYGKFKAAGMLSAVAGLKETSKQRRKMRIVEYGHYARYLKLWKEYVPPERMCILIFEEDILLETRRTLKLVYKFLNLDPNFEPIKFKQARNKSKGWSWVLLNYYLSRRMANLSRKSSPLRWFFDSIDKNDFLKVLKATEEDIEYLRSIYLPEKEELETLLCRKLDCWHYGL